MSSVSESGSCQQPNPGAPQDAAEGLQPAVHTLPLPVALQKLVKPLLVPQSDDCRQVVEQMLADALPSVTVVQVRPLWQRPWSPGVVHESPTWPVFWYGVHVWPSPM